MAQRIGITSTVPIEAIYAAGGRVVWVVHNLSETLPAPTPLRGPSCGIS